MRLGVDEVGVTELMGVTEHTRCLAMVARALFLERLIDEPGLLPPLDLATTDASARTLLEEIQTATAASLGTDRIPGLWRALTRNVHYLESTWRKEQVVMRSGVLTARDKRRVALGVAMNMGSRYMIEYNAGILGRAGDTDEDLLEVLGVVDHYNCLNTLSDGMQIPSDIRPPS